MRVHKSCYEPKNQIHTAVGVMKPDGSSYVFSHYCLVCDLQFDDVSFIAKCPECGEELKARRWGESMDGR